MFLAVAIPDLHPGSSRIRFPGYCPWRRRRPAQSGTAPAALWGVLVGFCQVSAKVWRRSAGGELKLDTLAKTLQLHNLGSSIFSIDIPSQGCWHPKSQIPCQFSWEPPRLHPPRPRPQQLQLPVSGWWLARFDVLTIQNVNVARLQL